MEVDELLKNLEEGPQQQPVALDATDCSAKRERIAALVAGGLGERFLGRKLTLEQVEKLPPSDIEKLYTRYEAILGASMSRDMGNYVIQMLSDLAAQIRSEINPTSLAADLEANPHVAHDLCVYGGSLFNRFGRLLTPLAVLLITFKHCRFGFVNGGDSGGNSSDVPEEGEKSNEGGSRTPICGGEES